MTELSRQMAHFSGTLLFCDKLEAFCESSNWRLAGTVSNRARRIGIGSSVSKKTAPTVVGDRFRRRAV